MSLPLPFPSPPLPFPSLPLTMDVWVRKVFLVAIEFASFVGIPRVMPSPTPVFAQIQEQVVILSNIILQPQEIFLRD